jgi:transcriptional regulator with XRE-family HTH domain
MGLVMVERIRQILQNKQLSPTQFADALGLARPIISHILSGRNKPSLEVVQKIIAAFPELSLPWLLSGQGPMLASTIPASAATSVAPVPAPASLSAPQSQRAKRSTSHTAEPVVASSIAAEAQPAPVEQPPLVAHSSPAPVHSEAPRVAPLPPEVASASQSPVATLATPQNAPQGTTVPVPNTATAPNMLSAFAEPGKTIRRIVIFYHDGTFSAYQPEMLG